MKKRIRMSYMKLVLPLVAAGLVVCLLLLLISNFGIRYAFQSPQPLISIGPGALDGAYGSVGIPDLEGTFARYGLPAEEGETELDISERFCVAKVGEDCYIGVHIVDDAQLDEIETYLDAREQLGDEALTSRHFSTLVGTINPMGDELYDFFYQWGEEAIQHGALTLADMVYTTSGSELSEEDVAYLSTHILPWQLEVGCYGSHSAALVYVLTILALLFLLAALVLLVLALSGRFDRTARALLRADAAAAERDYGEGEDFGKSLRICPENCWWFKRAGTEVFRTKDIIWTFPRSRRLEGGRIVWLLVMRTEARREYSVLLGAADAVEGAIAKLEAYCPLLSVGFDKEKQKRFDKDMPAFKAAAKREKIERENAAKAESETESKEEQ